MKPSAHALRMTIRLNEAGPRPTHLVATDIVARAHAAGLLAATVYPMALPDEGGEAAHRTISLSDERALTVTIIDTDEKIRAFVPQLRALLGGDEAISLDPVDGKYELSDRS